MPQRQLTRRQQQQGSLPSIGDVAQLYSLFSPQASAETEVARARAANLAADTAHQQTITQGLPEQLQQQIALAAAQAAGLQASTAGEVQRQGFQPQLVGSEVASRNAAAEAQAAEAAKTRATTGPSVDYLTAQNEALRQATSQSGELHPLQMGNLGIDMTGKIVDQQTKTNAEGRAQRAEPVIIAGEQAKTGLTQAEIDAKRSESAARDAVTFQKHPDIALQARGPVAQDIAARDAKLVHDQMVKMAQAHAKKHGVDAAMTAIPGVTAAEIGGQQGVTSSSLGQQTDYSKVQGTPEYDAAMLTPIVDIIKKFLTNPNYTSRSTP